MASHRFEGCLWYQALFSATITCLESAPSGILSLFVVLLASPSPHGVVPVHHHHLFLCHYHPCPNNHHQLFPHDHHQLSTQPLSTPHTEVEDGDDQVLHRLCPAYAQDVNSPLRHVRTRIYYTSESHMHSLLNVLRFCHLGGGAGGWKSTWQCYGLLWIAPAFGCWAGNCCRLLSVAVQCCQVHCVLVSNAMPAPRIPPSSASAVQC